MYKDDRCQRIVLSRSIGSATSHDLGKIDKSLVLIPAGKSWQAWTGPFLGESGGETRENDRNVNQVSFRQMA